MIGFHWLQRGVCWPCACVAPGAGRCPILRGFGTWRYLAASATGQLVPGS